MRRELVSDGLHLNLCGLAHEVENLGEPVPVAIALGKEACDGFSNSGSTVGRQFDFDCSHFSGLLDPCAIRAMGVLPQQRAELGFRKPPAAVGRTTSL